ncbi:hypothetical protein DOTSEDRAFT_81214 [Dothistroma septosporum NZE10]|uniref:Uncharacterized protein n=1 Tax=Dothistroma septosporum (strain NZE10 / CBS 128990) TaxID=675120 RepID=N1PLU9_DOTSN|nr:hypothetical protein DOTSEDRAFT_81214 [Dothistroma septosporum NZE10]
MADSAGSILDGIAVTADRSCGCCSADWSCPVLDMTLIADKARAGFRLRLDIEKVLTEDDSDELLYMATPTHTIVGRRLAHGCFQLLTVAREHDFDSDEACAMTFSVPRNTTLQSMGRGSRLFALCRNDLAEGTRMSSGNSNILAFHKSSSLETHLSHASSAQAESSSSPMARCPFSRSPADITPEMSQMT